MTSSNPKKDPVEESPEKIVSGPSPFPIRSTPRRCGCLPHSKLMPASASQLTTFRCAGRTAQEWIRVHPDPAFRGNFGVIILKDDNEVYLLAPA